MAADYEGLLAALECPLGECLKRRTQAKIDYRGTAASMGTSRKEQAGQLRTHQQTVSPATTDAFVATVVRVVEPFLRLRCTTTKPPRPGLNVVQSLSRVQDQRRMSRTPVCVRNVFVQVACRRRMHRQGQQHVQAARAGWLYLPLCKRLPELPLQYWQSRRGFGFGQCNGVNIATHLLRAAGNQ